MPFLAFRILGDPFEEGYGRLFGDARANCSETAEVLLHGTMAATSAFLAEGMRQGAIADADPGHLAVSIIGLHLTWFAAAPISSGVVGTDVLAPAAIKKRREEVRTQIRRLCGST